MPRRDILQALRKQSVRESDVIPQIDDQQELADAFRREIRNVNHELQKHRAQAAEIKPKALFERLYSQKTHHTLDESRKEKEGERRDKIHNVVYGYSPLSSLFAKKRHLTSPETHQRATSVPPLPRSFS